MHFANELTELSASYLPFKLVLEDAHLDTYLSEKTMGTICILRRLADADGAHRLCNLCKQDLKGTAVPFRSYLCSSEFTKKRRAVAQRRL